MCARRVIITRASEVGNPEELASHPNVRGLWSLPRGYVLFEFYHPVFEQIYETTPGVASSARRLESVRRETAQAIAEEQRLLSKLHRDMPDSSDALMLLVPSQASFYSFLGRNKRTFPWPSLGCSPFWDTSRKIRVAGRLVANVAETVSGLKSVLEEWSDSAPPVNSVRMGSDLHFEGEYFSFKCDFSSPCGDATMALFMLLAATRSLTSLEAVGFFLPGDYSTPFRQIGSPEKSDQAGGNP